MATAFFAARAASADGALIFTPSELITALKEWDARLQTPSAIAQVPDVEFTKLSRGLGPPCTWYLKLTNRRVLFAMNHDIDSTDKIVTLQSTADDIELSQCLRQRRMELGVRFPALYDNSLTQTIVGQARILHVVVGASVAVPHLMRDTRLTVILQLHPFTVLKPQQPIACVGVSARVWSMQIQPTRRITDFFLPSREPMLHVAPAFKCYTVEDCLALLTCAPNDLKTASLVDTVPQVVTTCLLCMDRSIDTIFLTCRHVGCCAQCAKQLLNQQCPFCRCPIAQLLDLQSVPLANRHHLFLLSD